MKFQRWLSPQCSIAENQGEVRLIPTAVSPWTFYCLLKVMPQFLSSAAVPGSMEGHSIAWRKLPQKISFFWFTCGRYSGGDIPLLPVRTSSAPLQYSTEHSEGQWNEEIWAKKVILAGRSSHGKQCLILGSDSACQPALNLTLNLPALFQHIMEQICLMMVLYS